MLENLNEFGSANALFWTWMERRVVVVAATPSAMENATKNSCDIVDKLALTCNSGVQLFYTDELIVGASAR